VLAQMDQALQWTTDLGNAYYNQPQDLLQTVQVMRQRAQSAGNLEDSPQEQVSYDQGYIQLDPPNPQVVYVPAYNPWDVYGQPVSPYPGFSLLGSLGSFAGAGPVRFGMGIAMAAFNHTPFGWMGWALDWLSQSILFNHQDYYSRSTTVARWGGSRGGYPRAGLPRQPEGYGRSQAYQQQGAYARPSGQPQQPGYAGSRGYAPNSFAQGSNRGYGSPNGNFARPAIQNNYAYNRMPARPQQSYARPGYASGFYGGAGQGYANRPGSVYSSPQQNWRSAAPVQQRGGFAQRSYAAPAGRGFMESPGRQEHSGGFHLFGGGHSAAKSYGGGHAPRSFGGGRHSGGGGHSGGHSGGGHRR